METWKTIWRGVSGMATIAAMVLTAIGGIGFMISEGRWLFSIATLAVLCFAFKPMWAYITKALM